MQPLKQLRQPLVLATNNSTISATSAVTSAITRQRQTSLSDDSANIFRACATFGKPRDWLLHTINKRRDTDFNKQPDACDSLFVMAAHGAIIQYDIEPRYVSSEFFFVSLFSL